MGSPQINAWSCYTYEILCLWHIDEIKKALRILGIQSDVYSWSNANAQIDLVFDRKDQTISVFEIKFSESLFSITSKYLLTLMTKVEEFKQKPKTKKAVQLTFITTYGLAENENKGMVQRELTMNELF